MTNTPTSRLTLYRLAALVVLLFWVAPVLLVLWVAGLVPSSAWMAWTFVVAIVV